MRNVSIEREKNRKTNVQWDAYFHALLDTDHFPSYENRIKSGRTMVCSKRDKNYSTNMTYMVGNGRKTKEQNI
jgi:hypothetical protein